MKVPSLVSRSFALAHNFGDLLDFSITGRAQASFVAPKPGFAEACNRPIGSRPSNNSPRLTADGTIYLRSLPISSSRSLMIPQLSRAQAPTLRSDILARPARAVGAIVSANMMLSNADLDLVTGGLLEKQIYVFVNSRFHAPFTDSEPNISNGII